MNLNYIFLRVKYKWNVLKVEKAVMNYDSVYLTWSKEIISNCPETGDRLGWLRFCQPFKDLQNSEYWMTEVDNKTRIH